MTSFGTVSPATSAASVFVESASPEDLAARAAAAIGLIAAANPGRLITAINLAGGGDGHTFVLEIESAPFTTVAGGINPATTSVQCYMAAQSEALTLARSRVVIANGKNILDEQLAGASQGTRFMGCIVETTADVNTSQGGSVLFSVNDFRIVDATAKTVGNTVANGGLLSSNTDPTLTASTNLSQLVTWAKNDHVETLGTQMSLPKDFDGRADATLELWVASGTTDAATFTVESDWNDVGLVTDTATDGTPSATMHKITATIEAGDIPDVPDFLSLYLHPASHTTDDVSLFAVRLSYKKLLS